MRRFITTILSVLLTIPLIACGTSVVADDQPDDSRADEDFHITGEWYGTALFENDYWPASLNENGDFHIYTTRGEWIYYHDGTIRDPWDEEYTGTRIQPNEDIIICYVTENDGGLEEGVLYGGFFVNEDDHYLYFNLEAKPILITDKDIIPRKDGNTVEYQLIDDTLYISNGEEYIRGEVELHGNDVFLCPLDEEPVIEYDYNMGVPVYLFIRSSIIE